jgi:hypothetical protein
MVLQAYGLEVSNSRLRAIANQLQGTSGYNDGVALDYLQAIGRQAGLQTDGLYDANGHYRKWTMGDVIQEIRHGYPVITLVHFASLPSHTSSTSTSDHYVVVVGVSSAGFVINDPASVGNEGYHNLLRPEQLLNAWGAASIQNQAVAFLPPKGALQSMYASSASPSPAQPAPTPSSANSNDAPPVTVVEPTVPSAPQPSRSAPGNSSFPASIDWQNRVSGWQHASPVPTLGTHLSPATDAGSAAVVLSARDSNTPSPLPSIIIVWVIGALALAILKAPRRDDDHRRY